MTFSCNRSNEIMKTSAKRKNNIILLVIVDTTVAPALYIVGQ